MISMVAVVLIENGGVNIKPLKDLLRDDPNTETPSTTVSSSPEVQQNKPLIIPDLFVPDVIPSIVNGFKEPKNQTDRLILGAAAQYGVTNSYNGAYKKLSYPNGDVDISTGVCTDVIIRAFRSINVDLQKDIHQDMSRNFRKYPRKWGLKSTDRNIDHRRVPNMETYFTRKGYKIPIGTSTGTEHYQPGDLVVWRISGNLTHIGIVSDEIVPGTSRYFIIHNPIQGVEISDWLIEFEIINHFRIFKERQLVSVILQ